MLIAIVIFFIKINVEIQSWLEQDEGVTAICTCLPGKETTAAFQRERQQNVYQNTYF